jgi:hypothetical protein
MTTLLTIAAATLGIAAPATARSNEGSTAVQSPATEQPKICKMVVSDQPAKPFQMCLTKAEWDAKARADANDPNRMICHYEEEPGTRLHGRKICMPASEWAAQRQGDREAVERAQMQSCVPGGGC